MSTVIDLNCDIGEGFGRWRMPYDGRADGAGHDGEYRRGFHAGDPW
jgi:5-oxoprolinase (ATP-hydrolysing) subunit A